MQRQTDRLLAEEEEEGPEKCGEEEGAGRKGIIDGPQGGEVVDRDEKGG